VVGVVVVGVVVVVWGVVVGLVDVVVGEDVTSVTVDAGEEDGDVSLVTTLGELVSIVVGDGDVVGEDVAGVVVVGAGF